MANKTSDAIDVASRDLGNRIQGLRAQGRRLLSRGGGADHQLPLAERVRECLGRTSSHPRAIKVDAMQGRVILRGPILAAEKENLLEAVRSVSGVSEVDDQLTVHESAEGIPSLQGEHKLTQARSIFMQDNWPPALRAIAVVGGGVLGYYGLARRSAAGTVFGLAGAALVTRAAVNRPLLRGRGRQALKQPLDLHKTIYIEASPERVFDVWSKYENFPRFMSNVQQVQDLGDRRSRWTVSGPAGAQVEWYSNITESQRPELLAWRSEPDSTIEHRGQVRFEAADGGTRVTLDMIYSPPAGAVGQAFASLFSGSPKRQLEEDLLRMKEYIESGVPSQEAMQPVSHQQRQQQQQRPGEALH